MEKTFAIIKPDAVKDGLTGRILDIIELNKFNIIGMKKEHLSKVQVETFYAIHKERSWFGEMVNAMIASPVILLALEKQNAIADWRLLMGATNPAEAQPGTLRKMFGKNVGSNATHGSDSAQTAHEELSFFFPHLV